MEDVALTLQRSLLPRELPDVLGVELAGRYVPGERVAGDRRRLLRRDRAGDGRVVIAIGDVAGHGVLPRR